ncbi:orotidine-5'-phosphate decarboxylase [Silanimonas sp.]|jgi:orotidine-5'-phosphate decarboxylase|uniref:orotidine-5'-phosphate decarboxylase n=1 Tax=Silanimonas sp. TaxID=1929290 RepID=UPI0022BB5E35|nr:orotidine-5'-phosphate decarboxylase [Silanimonas sp.]MCZ8115324.1 orotidine-5'-phosphate decarboxylase [Silanimonas sp.]
MAAAATGFNATLAARWAASGSLLCVGIDPEPGRYPATLVDDPDRVFTFGKAIIDATAEFACAFKPQIAHFAAQGAEDALERLIAYVHAAHPGLPVILDAKRGDIGSTALNYAREAFDRFRADAVTANPYLGTDSLAPYLDRADKGVVVLCRTSNPGAADLQDLPVAGADGGVRPLYQRVAEKAARDWNANGNLSLVVGATWPEQLGEVRAIVGGDVPLLVPGIGAQGGDVEAVLKHGLNANRTGLIISSSRAILYASSGADFAEAAARVARETRDLINRYR